MGGHRLLLDSENFHMIPHATDFFFLIQLYEVKDPWIPIVDPRLRNPIKRYVYWEYILYLIHHFTFCFQLNAWIYVGVGRLIFKTFDISYIDLSFPRVHKPYSLANFLPPLCFLCPFKKNSLYHYMLDIDSAFDMYWLHQSSPQNEELFSTII